MPRPLRRPRILLKHWADPFTGDLAPARALFRETFGFAHEDRERVDNVILSLLHEYGDQPDAQVPIPAVLLLALRLRRGFGRGRGHLLNERDRRSRLTAAVEKARALARHLRRTSPHRYNTNAKAKHAAAETIAELTGFKVKEIEAPDHWQHRRRRSRAK